MVKVIILHGTTSRPERSWFPWLSWQCLGLGLDPYVPRLPTPQNQSLETWLMAYKEQCPPLDDSTILVGHSTGAPFALRLLESSETPIKGCLLVSAFSTRLLLPKHPKMEPLLYSFVDPEWNWPKILQSCKHFACFHGSNDQIVPLSEAQELATKLGAQLKVIPTGQHLNTEAGYLQFPEILNSLKEMLV